MQITREVFFPRLQLEWIIVKDRYAWSRSTTRSIPIIERDDHARTRERIIFVKTWEYRVEK